MKSNIIQRTTLFTLAFVMIASLVAFPASVSAAPKSDKKGTKKTTKKTTIPKSFANKEACVVELKTHSVASLKKYGNNRIDTRLRAVEKYPAKIDKAYAKYEKAAPTATAGIEAANGLNISLLPPKNGVFNSINKKPKVHSNKETLKGEVAATKKGLTDKKAELAKTNSSASAAETICSVMFDLRVYSYLDAKIKAQLAVDSAQLKVKRNESRYKVVVGTYQKYGSNKKYVKKIKNVAPKIQNLPDARDQSKALKDLQKRLDAVTVASLNSSPEAAAAGKKELADIAKAVPAISSAAKAQGPAIDSLYKTTKKVFKRTTNKVAGTTKVPTEAEVTADLDPELFTDTTEETDDFPETCEEPYCKQ